MSRQKSYRSQDVIQKAMNLFWTKGYQPTSMTELVAATGINKKSLYNEFGSKEQLFNSALQQYAAELEHRMQPLLVSEPGLENIERFLQLLKRNIGRGCLFTLTINETSSVSKEALEFIYTCIEKLELFFVQNIKSGQAQGSIRTDQNAKALSKFLSMSMLGLTTRARYLKSSDEMYPLIHMVISAIRTPVT